MNNNSKNISSKLIIIGISMVVLAMITLCLLFFQINFNTHNVKQNNWDSLILGQYIHEPPGKLSAIYENSEDSLSIEITEISLNQYQEYTKSCQDLGFNVEMTQSQTRYRAYNKDGYEITLNYYQEQNSIDFTLIAPIQMSQITWPRNEFGQMLPTPKSTQGKIEANDKSGLNVLLGETTMDDFNAYVLACSQKGFNVESEKTATMYTAKNDNNNILTVEYRGNNVIYISLQESKFETQIIIHHDNDAFNVFDINFYIDDNFIDIIDTDKTENYTYIFTKGAHVLKFENSENNAITYEETINISNEDTIERQINCTDHQITVEKISNP